MKRLASVIVFFGALLGPFVLSTPAQAQASRTWVSGVGDDANPCSRVAPCKTFAGAISKTAPGGEIDCLDPGGCGAVTITKSITIDCGAGQVGSILAAGTNGINCLRCRDRHREDPQSVDPGHHYREHRHPWDKHGGALR
jgi:hypothetical protein